MFCNSIPFLWIHLYLLALFFRLRNYLAFVDPHVTENYLSVIEHASSYNSTQLKFEKEIVIPLKET